MIKLKGILSEQSNPTPKTWKLDMDYDLGKRGGDIELKRINASDFFQEVTDGTSKAVLKDPEIKWFLEKSGIQDVIPDNSGFAFKPENSTVIKLTFDCRPVRRSINFSDNSLSRLHLYVRQANKMIVIPVYNNMLEKKLAQVFCK